jgi:hypothetical protein
METGRVRATAPGTPYNQRGAGPYTLGQGGQRYGADNKLIVENPAPPRSTANDRYRPSSSDIDLARSGVNPVDPDHPSFNYWAEAMPKVSKQHHSDQVQKEALRIYRETKQSLIGNMFAGQTPDSAQEAEMERYAKQQMDAYLASAKDGQSPPPGGQSPAVQAILDQMDALEATLRAQGVAEELIDKIVEDNYGEALDRAGAASAGQR